MATMYATAASRKTSPIDLPLAAVAALAVGFAAFVMPEGLLSRIVEASQLPSILSAAQPPLGTTARAGVSAAAALATFGTVFMLLRMLGGSARKVPKRQAARDHAPMFEVDEVDHTSTPRLRRADVHPDAPARRPILAARELGEPDLRMPAPVPAAAETFAAPEPEPELEPVPEPEAEPEPVVVGVEPAAEEDVFVREAVEQVSPFDELELSGPGIEMIVAEPVAEPAAVAAPEAPHAAAEPAGDETIAELMARLERGLSRRVGRTETAAPADPVRQPQPQPQPEPEPVAVFRGGGDDRLRSAMENLQKMAARAG